MAKKEEVKKEETGITLRAGATVRNGDGVPRKLKDAVIVQVENRSGRQYITSPEEFLGDWFDVREI